MAWAGAGHSLSRGSAEDKAAEVEDLSNGDREAPALPAGNRSSSPCESPAGNSTSSATCRRAARLIADQGTRGDGGYLRCEPVCRQANSAEETGNARYGSHFAETQSFRSGSHLAEKVVPSQTVTDTRGRVGGIRAGPRPDRIAPTRWPMPGRDVGGRGKDVAPRSRPSGPRDGGIRNRRQPGA
jgi:hypothetical protein